MSYSAVGSPLGPFGDAVLDALIADGRLFPYVGVRILATLKESAKTVLPYIVGARRDFLPGSIAMQREGGQPVLWLDVWSEKNGPNETHQILSIMRTILSRDRLLSVPEFAVTSGSLVCDEEHVFGDFDPDMPQKSLFHGVLRVTAEVEGDPSGAPPPSWVQEDWL